MIVMFRVLMSFVRNINFHRLLRLLMFIKQLRKTDMHNHKSPLRKRQNSAAVKNMKNRIDSPRRVW